MFSSETKAKLKNGDPDAFREVFRLLFSRLKGYCRLFVPDENQAEDLIQECFIALWEKRNTIDPKKKIESLLFVMLRNRCLNYLKNQRLHSENNALEKIPASDLQFLYQLDLAEKEEKSLEELLVLSLQEAIHILPPKMRTVFVRCKLNGEKQKAVAKELGISLKMTEKHISRAKKQIREQLIKEFPTLTLLIAMLFG